MKKSWGLIVIGLLVMTAFLPIASAEEPTEGRAGRSEIRFLEGMIDHHQLALDMAADCLNKAQTAEMTALCQGVIEAQSAEIEQMQGWLLDWYGIQYAPVSMIEMIAMPEASEDEMDHGRHTTDAVITDPPMTMGMFAGFNRLEGIDYEIAWLESMIDHHDDALHMSERVLGVVAHDSLRELAQTIIDAQTAEIDKWKA